MRLRKRNHGIEPSEDIPLLQQVCDPDSLPEINCSSSCDWNRRKAPAGIRSPVGGWWDMA